MRLSIFVMLSLGLCCLSQASASVTRAGVRIHRLNQTPPTPHPVVKSSNMAKPVAPAPGSAVKTLPIAQVRPAAVPPATPAPTAVAPVAPKTVPVATSLVPDPQQISTRPVPSYSTPVPPQGRQEASTSRANVVAKPVAPPPSAPQRTVVPPSAVKPAAAPPTYAQPPKKRRRLPIAPVADGSTSLPPIPDNLIAAPAQL